MGPPVGGSVNIEAGREDVHLILKVTLTVKDALKNPRGVAVSLCDLLSICTPKIGHSSS